MILGSPQFSRPELQGFPKMQHEIGSFFWILANLVLYSRRPLLRVPTTAPHLLEVLLLFKTSSSIFCDGNNPHGVIDNILRVPLCRSAVCTKVGNNTMKISMSAFLAFLRQTSSVGTSSSPVMVLWALLALVYKHFSMIPSRRWNWSSLILIEKKME